MTGLKIQVNGRGLIPRGYGLAPRKEPFLATDINFLYLLLNTKGLSIKFVNPTNNRLEDLTQKNMKRMWDMYANYVPPKEEDTVPTNPVVPEKECTYVPTDEKITENYSSDLGPDDPGPKGEQGEPGVLDSNQSSIPVVQKQNNGQQQKNGGNNKKHH